jgi:hypothetical protein
MAKIETFLAPETKLVINRPDRLRAEWYATKKPIVVDLAKCVETTCPFTGVPVLKHIEAGIEVFFPRLVVRSRLVLEPGDVDPKAFDQTYTQFQYDIPEHSPYPNPSGWLRSIAVRDTLSCWIVRKGDIGHNTIGNMLDAGVTVKMRDYAAHETKQLVEDMVRSLYQQAQEAAASVARREASAEEFLAQAQEDGLKESEARKGYETRIKAIARDINVLTGDITKVAASLGLSGCANFINLAWLQTITKQTTDRMTLRARAYRQAEAALVAAGTPTTLALAAGAAVDQVIPEVMADALREAGDEAGADVLQAAFAEDHTFSLAGTDE